MIAYIAVLLDVAFPFFISKPWILPVVIVGAVKGIAQFVRQVGQYLEGNCRQSQEDHRPWIDVIIGGSQQYAHHYTGER